MGKKVCEKLHSGKGASLLLAMLLLLVCTVMGSVLLVAATTTNTTAVSAADDQNYYALTSAVDLLRAQMNDRRAQVRITTVAAPAVAPPPVWYAVDDSGADTGETLSEFSKMMAVMAIGDPVSGQSDYALADSFSIVPKINGTPQDNLAVQVTVAATKNGGRTLVLKMQNDPAATSRPASMRVTLTADILKEELKQGDVTYTIYTVTWGISDVKRSSAAA